MVTDGTEGFPTVVMACERVDRVQTIPDSRRQCRNLKHRLEDILVLGFRGTLAGGDDFVEIVAWANHNSAFFRTFLALPHGIPSHDTFNRVFATVTPAALQEVLLPWLLERRGLPGDWVHRDGKTMRPTRCHAKNLGALPVVSAWACQTGLTLGQVAVEAKSNEITALPQLIELLDLRNKIATIDAMGCQKEIAACIVEQQGDSLLSAKDHQPTLAAEIQTAFATAAAKPCAWRHEYTTEDGGHGRHERRTVRVLPAAGKLSPVQFQAWLGLLTLVMVVRVVTCQVTGPSPRRRVISSAACDRMLAGLAERFGAPGVLRMAGMGCWMWCFAKMPGGCMSARRPRTSPS